LERLNQFFCSHCRSRKCSCLFDFLGSTKFKFDACRGGSVVVLCHFFDGDGALACLILETGEFCSIMSGEGLDRSREQREGTEGEILCHPGAHDGR
jgi:hypothetical protein